MKLFVFKPSKYWNYCGGVLMATASSFEEACQRLKEKLKEIGESNDVKFRKTDFDKKEWRRRFAAGTRTYDVWVLLYELNLEDGSPDICLVEYNYA